MSQIFYFLSFMQIILINNEICKRIEWLHMNKLFLNIEKTQYMIFSLRKKIKPEKDIYEYV